MDPMQLRLAELERSCGRMKRALAAVGGLAVVLAVAGAARQPAPSGPIRTSRLEIVDARGATVLTLASNDNGGVLAVRAPSGEVVVTLTATAGGEGVIAVSDSARRRLVEISGRPGAGEGVISTFAGGAVAAAITSSDGTGTVTVFDRRGRAAGELPQR